MAKKAYKTNKRLVGKKKLPDKRYNVSEIVRTITQALFFAYVGMISLTHMYGNLRGFGWPGSSAASLDAYCPFGGLVSLPSFIGSGQLPRGADFNGIILLGALIILVLLFGGGFCGYLCPLGSVSEWLYKIRAKLLPFKLKLPAKIARYMSYFRFAVLVFLLTMTTIRGYLVFTQVDPYRALMHFGHEWTVAIWIFILIWFIPSLLINRPFCNFLCPLGFVIGGVSTISMTKIRRDGYKCISCGKCDEVCPMYLTPSGDLEYHRCIMCGKCVSECPVDGALNVEFAGRVWK